MRKFFKPIFSKKILGAILLILQLLLVFAMLDKLYANRIVFYGGTTAVAAIMIIYEINRDVSPSFKIIWIAIMAVIPLFGVMLYLYVHLDVLINVLRKRFGTIKQKLKTYTDAVHEGIDALREEAPGEADIFEYLMRCADAPCFKGGDTKYFEIGEQMYADLIEKVKKAEKFIFIEFFIINEKSEMWSTLLKILKQKAESGVEVRIIYDGMGSLTCTDGNLPERLADMGIKCRIFSPVKPFISTYHNNRDHRKIIVIDGKYAYTGGVNIADEYINRRVRFGHWKDTALRIEGDAVNSFSAIFLKLWSFIAHEGEEGSAFITESGEGGRQNGFIAPFDDNPLDNERVTENVYLHMINNAKKYIYITTPYLILDDDLSDSLRFAAKRGIDVKVTMPHIPDKWYAFALARTYYPELIRSGVKIYEYTPGFIHAKSTVSDGVRAFIGSANYDFRSLYLHYECGVYMYNNSAIDDMTADYNATLEKCEQFTLEDYKSLSIFYRLAGRVFRLFAPLM